MMAKSFSTYMASMEVGGEVYAVHRIPDSEDQRLVVPEFQEYSIIVRPIHSLTFLRDNIIEFSTPLRLTKGKNDTYKIRPYGDKPPKVSLQAIAGLNKFFKANTSKLNEYGLPLFLGEQWVQFGSKNDYYANMKIHEINEGENPAHRSEKISKGAIESVYWDPKGEDTYDIRYYNGVLMRTEFKKNKTIDDVYDYFEGTQTFYKQDRIPQVFRMFLLDGIKYGRVIIKGRKEELGVREYGKNKN